MAQTGTKRFLFKPSDEEAADATVLVNYAQGLPVPQKTGDEFLDGESKTQRESFQKIANLLWRNPSCMGQVLSAVEGAIMKSKKFQGQGCVSNSSLFRALDDDWAGTCIVSNSKVRGSQMESVMRFDPDSARQVLQHSVRVAPTLKFPETCKEKAVLAKAMKQRITDVKNRLDSIDKDHFSMQGSGGIDWWRIGVYGLAFNEGGRATEITHRPSCSMVEFPQWIYVDKSFTLEQNWDDNGAALVTSPAAKVMCVDLFESDKGANPNATVSGASKIVDDIAGAVVTKRANEKNTLAEASGEVTSKRFKTAATAQARLAGMRDVRVAMKEKQQPVMRERSAKFD